MKQSRKSKRKHSNSQSSQSSNKSQYLSQSHSSQQDRKRKKNNKSHKHKNKDKKRQRSNSYQKNKQKSKHKDKKKHKQYTRQRSRQKYNQQSYKQKQRHKQKYSNKQENIHIKHEQNQKYQNDKSQQRQSHKYQPNQQQRRKQNKNQKQRYQNQFSLKEQQKTQKQLPCFQPSGILLQYYNARQGVSLRFHQPPQSRQPNQQWRIYIFKGQQVLKPIILSKSSYLIGKDDRVVDILAQNSSISRQHAVIQFRLVQKRQTQRQFVQFIKPYVMDLQSTNGTILNDQKIQPGRYYELLHRDVLKFGFSDREYVLVKWQEGQQQE